MTLKRRYKAFKYALSWRFPALHAFIRISIFPLQVTGVGVALYAVVKFLT